MFVSIMQLKYCHSPNYRTAGLVATHCCQTKEREREKKELCNFELDLKNVFMPYSQCTHIWAGMIRGRGEEAREPRNSDKKPKKHLMVPK